MILRLVSCCSHGEVHLLAVVLGPTMPPECGLFSDHWNQFPREPHLNPSLPLLEGEFKLRKMVEGLENTTTCCVSPLRRPQSTFTGSEL